MFRCYKNKKPSQCEIFHVIVLNSSSRRLTKNLQVNRSVQIHH
jgi:hypothetical protein